MPIFAPLAQARVDRTAEIVDSLARTPLSTVVLVVAVLTVFRVLIFPKLAKTPPHLRGGSYQGLRFVNELLDAVVYAGVFVFLIIRPFGVQMFRIPSGSMWPTLYVNDYVVANKAIYRLRDPEPGEIVVFRPPVEAILNPAQDIDADGQVKVDYIKRCVGKPGDVVELRDGILYRNGKAADDSTKHYSVSNDAVNYQDVPESDVAKASFKLVKYKGQIIPLNYNGTEANNDTSGFGYSVAPKFVIPPDEQAALIAAKPEPIPASFYMMMGDNRNNSFDGRGWGLVARDRIVGRSEYVWFPIGRFHKTPAVSLDK